MYFQNRCCETFCDESHGMASSPRMSPTSSWLKVQEDTSSISVRLNWWKTTGPQVYSQIDHISPGHLKNIWSNSFCWWPLISVFIHVLQPSPPKSNPFMNRKRYWKGFIHHARTTWLWKALPLVLWLHCFSQPRKCFSGDRFYSYTPELEDDLERKPPRLHLFECVGLGLGIWFDKHASFRSSLCKVLISNPYWGFVLKQVTLAVNITRAMYESPTHVRDAPRCLNLDQVKKPAVLKQRWSVHLCNFFSFLANLKSLFLCQLAVFVGSKWSDADLMHHKKLMIRVGWWLRYLMLGLLAPSSLWCFRDQNLGTLQDFKTACRIHEIIFRPCWVDWITLSWDFFVLAVRWVSDFKKI